MDFNTKHFENKSVIVVEKNKLIGTEGQTFQDQIQSSIDNGSNEITIDIAKVEFLSSWGIGMLVHAYTTCRNRNINFQISNVNKNVLGVLNQLKMTQLFNIS